MINYGFSNFNGGCAGRETALIATGGFNQCGGFTNDINNTCGSFGFINSNPFMINNCGGFTTLPVNAFNRCNSCGWNNSRNGCGCCDWNNWNNCNRWNFCRPCNRCSNWTFNPFTGMLFGGYCGGGFGSNRNSCCNKCF